LLKDVTRNHKSNKEIQRPNDKGQKDKKKMIYKTRNKKLMIEQQEPHKNIGDELTCSEWHQLKC